MYVAAQTNHQITKYAVENKWHGDLFTNEENLHEKTPPDDFKVTSSKNPLLSKQAVTSKGMPVPYINLQLNPYPNTQLDLFCSDNLSFSMHDSQYLTNQLYRSQYMTLSPTWERCWLQSSSIHHTMKIKKLLGHKILRCTNIAASSRERKTRAN